MTELAPHTLLNEEPSGGALCTLADVRQLMQMNEEDTEQDTIIASLIIQAGDLIKRHTEREFALETDDPEAEITRRFEIDLSLGYMTFAPYDLQSVTSVVLDPDDTATALQGTDYRLGPLPQRDGVYRTFKLMTAQGAGTVEVDITGLWGFPTVPRPVRLACAQTVVTWLRRDVSAFTTTYNLDEGKVERPEDLPSAIKAMLCRYKLEVIG